MDEAHTLGAYGEQGRGLIDDHRSIISINPCGKAMGASGAFISGPIWLRDLLISSARSFIYTTAPSPWIAAALNACIPMIVRAEQRRQHLQTISDDLRSCLRQLGFNLGASHSHIIPVILGSEAKALHAEQYLARREIHARAIRPPTVAEDSCRLRLSLHAGLSSQDIAKLKEAMQGLAHEI